MVNEFEEILLEVGSYGKYQKLMVTLVLIPTSFFTALTVNTVIFQTVVPEEYWCNPPGIESTNFTKEEWWNLTVPRLDNWEFEKCLQFHIETEDGKYISTNTEITTKCSSGWEYDHSLFEETMATSMRWLCDKEIYSTHILSANLAGNAVGTLLLPIIADRFTGRKVMFFISVGIHLIFNLLALAVSVYSLFLTLRFLGGLSFQSNFQMPYVIGLELTSPDKRAVVSFYSFVAWTMGLCSTALVAWLVPHWWNLIVITCIISLLFFSYWRYLPESPRWLLSKGKIAECTDMLLKIAKINGKRDMDRKAIEKKLMSLADQEEKFSFKEILKFNRVFINALLITFVSFTTFMAYGCTLVNIKILPNNYFLSFFVLSLSELPSNISSYLSVQYLGRRFTAIVTSIMSIAFCLMATFFFDDRVTLLVVVALIKIFLTQNIYVIYVIASEVFPTPIRSTGLGVVVVAGMIGLVFSPYIVAVSEGGAFQYWTMLVLSSGSLILSLPLPETIGLALPQTFPEADVIGRERPYFRWIHHWNKHNYQSVSCHEEKPEERSEKL